MSTETKIPREDRPMTTTTRTIPLARLTDLIREEEGARAPGSETTLWGDYTARMEDVTGHLPYHDHPEDVTVPLTEAAWWLGAYAAQAAAQELGHEAPAAPLDDDYTSIVQDLGLDPASDDDAALSAVEEQIDAGYEWYRETYPVPDPEPLTGADIRRLRLHRDETQAEFAAAVGIWGDAESRRVTVSRWETGVGSPSPRYEAAIRGMMAEKGVYDEEG